MYRTLSIASATFCQCSRSPSFTINVENTINAPKYVRIWLCFFRNVSNLPGAEDDIRHLVEVLRQNCTMKPRQHEQCPQDCCAGNARKIKSPDRRASRSIYSPSTLLLLLMLRCQQPGIGSR